MDINENSYQYFMAALNHFLGQRWGGSQTRLHNDTGLSESMISLIRSNKKRAGLKSQFKIAKAMGYAYETFIEIGRSIVETGSAPDITPHYFSRRASDPANLHRLPRPANLSQMGHVTPASGQYAKLYEALDTIIRNGDLMLISIAETSLNSLANTKKEPNKTGPTRDPGSQQPLNIVNGCPP